MSVVIRVIYEGTTYDLDIQEDIPLRLDISAIENTEIGEFFGVGSQTFDLPGTKNNNKFFKHAYNIGGEDIPAFYNTIDGKIISKGETLLKGQFQLLETVKDEAGFVVYKCQITDETVQFKDNIQNKLIKNADWSSYTHTLNTGSILDSWNGNLLGGKIFYPLADYGYNDPESQGNYPLFAFGTYTPGNPIPGGFINSTFSPIQPTQFLPSLRAKDVIQTICAQAGFSASGDFLNSDALEDLYILPKAKEEIGINVTGSEQATGYANNNYNQSIPIGSGPAIGTELAANTIVVDPLNKFNVSGSEGYVYYDADGNGNYEASAQIGFFNPVSFAQGEVQVDLKLVRGSFTDSSFVMNSTSRTFTSQDGFNTFTMNVGASWTSTTNEDVWVYVDYYPVSGTPTNSLNLFGFSSILRIDSAPEVFNDATVDISLQWPADLKSIDIIKGLIQQFNLVVYPHPTQSKTIVFEQFDDWVRSGESKDWTEKWDTATRVSVKHTIDEEPQELILGNQEDNDRFSVEAKESDPFFQYGTLRVLADNNISQGSKSVKNIFAPTVLGGPYVSGSVTAEGNPTYNIDLGSSFAFPHLYKFENNQLKSYKFRTRLGYKVSNQFPSGSDIYRVVLGTGYGETTIVTGSYSTLSNTKQLPADNGGRDLHFNNTYFKFAGAGLNLSNTTSNFDSNWKTYVDSLYWDENRKVTLDIQFNSDEYKNIKLNDIIFVKDQQYRINKISGFNVTQDDVATVELIRLYPQYYQNNPDCDFNISLEALDCDFTFEAIPGVTPTPTPAPPTPTPVVDPCVQYRVRTNSDGTVIVNWTCCEGGEQTNTLTQPQLSEGSGMLFSSRAYPSITGSTTGPTDRYDVKVLDTVSMGVNDVSQTIAQDLIVSGSNIAPNTKYYYSYIDTGSCEWTCGEFILDTGIETEFAITAMSGSIKMFTDSGISPYEYTNFRVVNSFSHSCDLGPTPTPIPPSPTPTLPPGPTPTPTPGGQTPTPTPTPAPQVFSYTGFAGYSNYLDACSGSAVTIYTQGPIGTGSIAYEDAQLTNVFDFNRFFIDENTGIGYEFVDPNTTGTVIGIQNDACNVEVFNLYISFNEYDACTETVANTVYGAPGSTLSNGTTLYEDINLQYSWWGQTGYEVKFIESGSDPKQIYYNTATGVSASGTEECYTVYTFDGWDSTATTPPSAVCGDTDETFYAQGIPSIGDNIFTDAALTDPIFTGEKFVYNDDANVLYVMSGSTGGDGSGWVIGSITSSYCSPATPTPSPTPAPIVTQMSVSASWSSYYDACTNPGFTGTLYLTSLWQSGEYVDYFYEDNTQTNIFDFYQFVVDSSTGIGYRLPDPNTTGRVISTGSDVCNPGIFSLGIDFNEYEACTGCVTTTKYAQEQTMRNGLDIYTDIELEYDWTEGIGTQFTISGSTDLWVYTGAERFGGSGAQLTTGSCYTIYGFFGRDYNYDPGTIYCGGTYISDFFTKGTPAIGLQVYNDACLTDTISTARSYVYNSETEDLYVMGTDPTSSLHSIQQIITDYCLPPTPTPSPTPAPIVTALGAVTASTHEPDGFAGICDGNGSLVTGSGWLVQEWEVGSYSTYMYKDANLTTLWTQAVWMVDSNNDGYYFSRENLNGRVNQIYDGPICQSGSAINTYVQFQSSFDDFCSGSGYYNKTVYISESRSDIQDYDYIFENESCTEVYNDQYRTIREVSNGNVWVVADSYNQPAVGSREYGQVFPHDPQCNVPVTPLPTITPVPTATPTPTPYLRWMILEGELCTQTSSTQRYNWYGDPNNFPAALAYDSNIGWCMDMYYVQDGYNSNYPEMDCSTRYAYYNTCSDCQSQTNAQPCSGVTPTPTGTPVPTPAPTTPPNVGVYEVRECYTSPTFYAQYNSGSLPSNNFGSGSGCYEVIQQVSDIYWSPNLPVMESFFNSCGDCFGPATPIPSSTPTPTPAPTASPTPVPTSTPSYKSYGLYECGTTTAYYFKYDVGTNGDLVANDVLVYGTKCYRVIVEVDYFETDPEISGFVYDNCTDCQQFGL